MSLPAEIRDQLLSGYLDDALSADERARVERMLETDTDFARELEELREMRQSLQTIFQQDSVIKLGHAFSSRVVDAAVSQARTEGLGHDHPLIRLSGQPDGATASRSNRSRQLVGVLIGLAASIALAAVVYFPSQDQGDDVIAQQPVDQQPDDSASPVGELGDPGRVDLAAADADSNGTTATGSSIADGDSITDDSRGAAGDAIAQTDPTLPTETPQIETDQPQDRDTPSVDMIAEAGTNDREAMTERETAPEAVAADPLLQGGNLVLVYSVRLSDAGRENDALGRAMRAADITMASDQPVTDEIASYVSSQQLDAVASSEGPTILYLQASQKRLDRLYLSLMSDEEGVESCGLALCMDAPVMKLTRALQIDPVQVQHQPRMLQLATQHEAVQEISAELDALPFNFRRSREVPTPPESDGLDPVGQVLVVVR